MKHAVRRHLVVGCVLAVVGGIVVWTLFVCDTFACIPSDNDKPEGDNFSSGQGSDDTKLANQSTFVITASPSEPMSPGVRVPLDLRLQNSNKASMTVTELEVSVQRLEAPKATEQLPCLLEDFIVDQAPDGLDLDLPPRATTSLSALSLPIAQWPRIGLRNTSVNQDGCKSASLTLDFTASGTVDP